MRALQVNVPRSSVRGPFDQDVQVTLQPWGSSRARTFGVNVLGGSVRFDDAANTGRPRTGAEADATVAMSLLIEVPANPVEGRKFEGNVICLPFAVMFDTTPKELATSAFEANVSPDGQDGYKLRVDCLRFPMFYLIVDIPAGTVPGLP